MGKILKTGGLLLAFSIGFCQIHAQLVVNGGTLTINSNAFISVQGNLSTTVDIQGPGKIIMNGSGIQEVNTNTAAIPNLEINTTGEVQLTGNSRVSSNLNFVNGKIKTGNFDLVLDNAATTTGHNATRFIWTNGTGQVKKNLAANVTNIEIPLGENNNYRPAYVTTTGSSFSNANIGLRMSSGVSPNRPPQIANSLNAYWAVTRTGISGGTVRVEGQYTDADVVGTEAKLAGYYFNGTDWSSANETHSEATNRVSAVISQASGQLYGMNRFVAVGARAILQGAGFNTTTSLMNDNLRTAPRLIPLTDPYRVAPFTTSYIHVNNPTAETALATVFADQASVSNNIVDWVFLELRNTNSSPGNQIVQTRSALLQRDGDIVDVDGVSPVTFNTPDGNFGLVVRHRNHLALSMNPVTGARAFSEKQSLAFTTAVADLRTAPQSQLYGTAANHTSVTQTGVGTFNALWGGNANSNANTRYTSGANDKDVIYAAGSVTGVYHHADLNMNRAVRYNSGGNDKDFLYINVLGGATTNIRTQAIPN